MMRRIKLLLYWSPVFLLLGLALYGGIWSHRLSSLATQYIHHRYDGANGKVHYTLNSSRPSYWVPLGQLDQQIYGAILVSEDWGFYLHSGLDIAQIRKAVRDFLKGERLRGASTITQQLVKNMYLHHQRSWGRKAKEAFLALIVERVLSKQRILELYLNIIEYGQGVYGIAHAAQYYFQKPAQDLSVQQSAFLAVLLPNPQKYSQSFLQGEPSPFIIQGVREVLEKMRMAGYLSPEEFEQAVEVSVIPDDY